jgi:23S rRNA (cytosine1962-C5)-methyltransferase
MLLERLAGPNERRVAVRVTKDAQRQLRGGHPWVFASSIASISHDGAIGDLAVIFDDNRRFLAIGLYDPTSPLRVRVLHRGEPRAIDDGFWRERIDASLERRRALAASTSTDAYRCIHGENDALAGLVLDRYDTTFVLKLDTAAWFAHLGSVVPILIERLAPERLVLRMSRSVRQGAAELDVTDGAMLHGDTPIEPVLFRENGLLFETDVVRGHKTGYFLDQRDNRDRVRTLAEGARVLDLFSCTGGFTVHAAAGGARSTHSVDISAPAIDYGKHNLRHNRADPLVARSSARHTVGDVFAIARQMMGAGERYDLIVVDPPSFAAKRADEDVAKAAYRRLTALAIGLLAPDGVLVQSSCSSRVDAETFFATVHEAASSAGRPLEEIERTTHGVDHPIGFAQGAYLKTLFARVQ